DVTIDVKDGVRSPAVRVASGTLFVKPPAGAGELEYAVAKLPARGVCRLFELSPAYQEHDAPLARALFLLDENVLDGAKLAFEEARRRNVDVSAFEARFAALPEVKPHDAGTQANGKPVDEKPVKDDGTFVAVPSSVFTQGVGDPTKKVIFYLGDHDPDRRNEWPKHEVQVDAYQIGKYEVTNYQYAKFLAALPQGKVHRFCHDSEPANKDHTPSIWKSAKFGGDAHPVVGVDWWDAYAYCKWAKGRLPSEAEWERAARGTDNRLFPWGNDWDWKKCVSAWFWAKEDARDDATWERFNEWVKGAPRVTLPVDALEEGKSPAGCHHMSGNVAEWTADWYDKDYYQRVYVEAKEKGDVVLKNPTGPPTGALRAVRGGRWGDRTPAFFVATGRTGIAPGTRVEWLGFRCAKGPDTK
ncbi:MAG: formylglycine-generating enzyme family protein, partial [Planctomycetota bacterium]